MIASYFDEVVMPAALSDNQYARCDQCVQNIVPIRAIGEEDHEL